MALQGEILAVQPVLPSPPHLPSQPLDESCDYATMGELMMDLAARLASHNGERPHRALGYHVPVWSMRPAGDGERIVNKFVEAFGSTLFP